MSAGSRGSGHFSRLWSSICVFKPTFNDGVVQKRCSTGCRFDSLSFATLLFSLVLVETIRAQTRTDAPTSDESTVRLSAFVVEEVAAKGYVQRESQTGLKTKRAILETPQAITVISREMMQDVGYTGGTPELVKWAAPGAVAINGGNQEAMALRGIGVSSAFLDLIPFGASGIDNFNVDTVEVIRGPNAVLFGQRTSVAGLVLRNSKVPLARPMQRAQVSVGSGEFYRAEIDTSGPVFSNQAGELRYRLTGVVQDFEGFFTAFQDDRFGIAPGLQFNTRDGRTVLRIVSDAQHTDQAAGLYGLQDPNRPGLPYTVIKNGKIENFVAPYSNLQYWRLFTKATFIHSLSPNWELQLAGAYLYFRRRDDQSRPSGLPNWTNYTLGQTYILNNATTQTQVGTVDVTGRFKVLGMESQLNAGLLLDSVATPKSQSDSANAAYQALYGVLDLRPTADYTRIPRPSPDQIVRGNDFRTVDTSSSFYFTQTVQPVKDRLFVVAGISLNHAKSTRTNKTRNLLVSDRADSGTPYRVGMVYKLLPGLSAFVNQATTFAPSTAIGINGQRLDPQTADVLDIGLKADLWEGRLVGGVTFFDLAIDGLNRTADTLSPITGQSYSIPNGKTLNQGIEVEFAFSPSPALTLMANAYYGDPKNENGAIINSTYPDALSFVGRYDFRRGTLKGLSVGGMFHRKGTLYLRSSGLNFDAKAFNATNVFASYRAGRVDYRLKIENVFDDEGINGPSTNFNYYLYPRHFVLSVGTTF